MFHDFLNDYFKNILNIKNVSVVIPIYNNEKYLNDCLNSVINQSLKNIEIICINDGSTDNSLNIIQKFSQLDKRIIIINQKNKGSGLSRNRGIKLSRGKFISFLDSDDMYYDNISLKSIFTSAQKNKATICGGGMLKNIKINKKYFVNETIFEFNNFIEYKNYQYDFDYQRFIYNRNFLKANKIFFPNLLRYQDPPFFIKAMFIAKRFYAIKKITNIYRSKPNKKLNLKQVIDMFSGLKQCLEFAEKMKLYKLYETSLNRLNQKMFVKRAKKFSQDKKLKNIIFEIYKSINRELIKKYNLKFNLNALYKNYIFSHF